MAHYRDSFRHLDIDYYSSVRLLEQNDGVLAMTRFSSDIEGARLSNWLADYSHDLMEEGDFDQEATEIERAAQWIADRLATPTVTCPYKGPFGCKCEPGECKYTPAATGGETRSSPATREALIARADKYLNTGSGEYAGEIMRDMAEFIRATPTATGGDAVAGDGYRGAWLELLNLYNNLNYEIAALRSPDIAAKRTPLDLDGPELNRIATEAFTEAAARAQAAAPPAWLDMASAWKHRAILGKNKYGARFVMRWKPQEQAHHDKEGWFEQIYRREPTAWMPLPGDGVAQGSPMVAALRDIISWKEDVLGDRSKPPGPYDCAPEITEAFDRGARMAFYRCALRASEVMSSVSSTNRCTTCNGRGVVGGFVSADSGYQDDPCPDCTLPSPERQT